jgi:hypothetical protein
MSDTTRQAAFLVLALGFVVWQASKGPDRAFAAILAVTAVFYAFAPVIRDGVAG